MKLAKLLADAYPGDPNIPKSELAASFYSVHSHCEEWWPKRVDDFFGCVIVSIYEHGTWSMSDEEFLPIARDVLKSFVADSQAMLEAVEAALNDLEHKPQENV